MELHLEFRPRDFDEIIGNKEIIRIMKSKLQKDKNEKHNFPHAVMLYGPKGSGKTTIARIISKELGCDPNSKSSDYQELDSVQTGGIDTTREIRENLNYAPMDQKCRVYVIDEVHAASSKFKEGLLKMTEDTPSHIYFILCTTDPQKVPATLRSRCAKYKVKSLNDNEMVELIDWVLNELEENIDKEIIEEIIDNADGCPREALVLLDSIIDLEPDKMLNAIQGNEVEKEVIDLCRAMLKNQSWGKLSKILKGMKGIEAERARYAIIGWFAGVALNGGQNVDKTALIFDCFQESVMYSGWPGIVFATYNTTL